MNFYKFPSISTNFHKYLPISLIFLIGTLLFFSQNSSISQPTTKAQSSYPQCQQGRITSPCQCGNKIYNAGFCCYHPNASSGIWFDPSYEDILPNGCPTGNFYFVDQNHPNASDENPGTEEEPWKTIEHATKVLEVGDVVLIKSGTYITQYSGVERGKPEGNYYYIPNLQPTNSGTSDSPIIFRAYPGDTVKIKADLNYPDKHQSIIGSYTKNNIVWDGFILDTRDMSENFKVTPVRIESASGVIIQNCEIIGHYFNGVDYQGIFLGNTQDILIKNCKIHNFPTPTNCGTGIKLFNNSGVVVEHCEIYGCAHGILDKEEGYNNIYRYNYIYNNTYKGIYLHTQDGLSTSDIQIYNNILLNNEWGVGFSCDEGMVFENVQIYNNIIYNSRGISPIRTPNLQLWNNIIYTDGLIYHCRCLGSKPAYSDYNCFYPEERFVLYNYTPQEQNFNTLNEWSQGTGLDNNSIHEDPKFTNPTSHNFHLQPSSPCLNAGIDRQDYDNDGNTTESINIGAYITGDEIIGLIDLSQYIVEEEPLPTCASQNGVCCNENQICQNGTFISSSDCGNLCCTGECVSPSIPGDLNQDNKVNSLDFQILIQKFKETQNIETEDLNSDGIVDVKDIGILMHYWTN